ncbi:MAG: hypothetical protein APG12_00489 [Candidatus Methanofastidiosum methylothiophilum]|uniref:Polymerase nucleotidyl transferase domain-containing protein n=1 Tax=Candidatus Methanofastidiosum methylothiophilum TaxID=1705564 RepID=A0A150ILQ8_9EURY|nr:MAG: hypothetical protein APG10_00356 [Candidatus Methanofastidiosum methylthiophilus]KYC48269.1 MAG: hypothetical protein APG11_00508 [Candidatus Methanofastidiosum methylthiophilus]KYC50926.1 MAG: hypothetical protein APG12_00489 [Candidatus Methanofastidiosum methylthiophilus]
MIREIIPKLLPLISGIGLVFGSYAKGAQNVKSDLDIFIAGQAESNKIKEISKAYKIGINLIVYLLISTNPL